MSITVRYFASLREALGPSETLPWPLPGGVATLAGLRELLIARGDPHAQVLAHGRALRCALDQVMVVEDAALADGAEVAFFPPVTGG